MADATRIRFGKDVMMEKSVNLATLLAVAGGLAVATLPSTASATCSPSGGGGGYGQSGPAAPQYDAASEYRAGIAALNAKDFKAAKTAFKHVMSVSSADANIFYLAGISRVGLADWKGARSMLEKAVKLNAAMVPAQRNLGITYAKLSDMAKARQVLDGLKASAATCAGKCADAADLNSAIAALSAEITA
jgi:tetratricopeptide (TPR) repeat protein